MDRELLALDLIGRIYDAAVDPLSWQEVAEGFSEALDDSAVCIALKLPDVPRGDRRFAARIGADFAADCSDAFVDETLRAPASRHVFARGFAFASPSPARPIETSNFHERWRSPRGLAAEWPIGHMFAIENGRPIALIVAYRKEGNGAFAASDFAFANRLTPHLARAFAMYRSHASVTRQHLSLAEVVDRLPAGVILLNEEGRVVFTSRSAIRILARNDGLAIADEALRATESAADQALQRCIAEVLTPPPDASSGVGGIVPAPRTPGDGAYPVSVSRLLPGRTIRDAVASVIVSDPDTGTEPAVELLRSLYNLTPAEAGLVGHLARGRSLEEAARARGVSINTARSHLKQVFFKTETHRQGELVQLVLRCFVPVAAE